ncbi:MAG: VCBS repeat-containing protein [Candidatus Eisenbacteria bacterium]|uniref:VCBS repeat-containing protein n=1 Tax=Eiseniibacteriota bacterium TaxID=2212470 RepID=A0A956SE56_UNCEI|nr:VCBS repeat-containing protein [Candidatus Eisenbacteria bacterium]MCB9465437.1 VCBS repeat-containing protein [Candidatus Eisenbacteria bacterium]
MNDQKGISMLRTHSTREPLSRRTGAQSQGLRRLGDIASLVLLPAALVAIPNLASADAPETPRTTPAPAQRIVFQLTEEAQGALQVDLASQGRTGLTSLDARLSALRPASIQPVFADVATSAAKSAAGLDRIYVLEYDAATSPQLAAEMAEDPHVVYAEPDIIHSATATWPNDPDVGQQWGHHVPDFPLSWTQDSDGDSDVAWDYETGDPNVTIAILDTGVDYDHEDLTDRIVAGWDYVNNDSDPFDDEGHGTACAGIAAASGDNGIGIAGVVWNCSIMPVKVLDETGHGASTWIANGITYATDHGANVISMSLGSDTPSTTIMNAANYAWSNGLILLASSGNDNVATVGYPAGFSNVMAVGAMSPCLERKNPGSCDGESWWGSNYGTGLDFLAPGVEIYTTDISGAGGYFVIDYYEHFNGTSSACPFAAGSAALVWSYLPTLTNAELRDLLRLSATDMYTPGWDNETGYGHINPASAVQAYYLVDGTGGLAGSAASIGVAWSDVDDDGDADLYVVNDGAANKYYRNDDGTFVDATSGLLGDSGAGASAAFGDADDDGDLDLYLARDGANTFLRNDGGTFVDATVAPLDNADIGTTTSWIDYDNDGDLDLYAGNDGSANIILRNDSGVFTDVTALPLGNTRPNGGFAWGDFNADGFMDLYIANTGQNRLLRNDGSGVFTNVTGGLGDAVTGRGTSWGDVDNDGDMDLFVANFEGENRLWINDGDGTSFTDIAVGTALADARDTRGSFFADFDNDGWVDLFTTNADGMNQLWRNESGQWFTSVAGLGPIADASDGRGTAWADFDRDGDIDWFVANADGANVFIRNDSPATRHWIRVKLSGNASNDRGIGARVRVVAGGLSQIREITAGNGHRAQDETIAQFGLAAATVIDSLVVTWPSGTIDVVEGLATVDAEVLFVEGQGIGTTAVDPVVPTSDSLLAQNAPNPFSDGTAIRFRIEADQQVTLEVFTADGRLVRNLVDGDRRAGEHLAVWDRKDARGNQTPSGVYYYRLKLADGTESARRLVIVD